MRKGRRDNPVGRLLLLLTFTLVGAPAVAARQDPQANPAGSPLVRLTLEVRWTGRERPGEPVAPAAGASSTNPVELEIPEGQGQVTSALTWPQGVVLTRPKEGAWRLGSDRNGRVRVRVEAALNSTLVFRCGGQVMNLPLAAVLEGAPPRTPAQFPIDLVVERLPWDVLSVSVGGAQPETPPQPAPMGDAAPPPPPAPVESDGLVAPGATVPVTVGVNILTPEPAEVSVRCQVEVRPLRGSEPPRRQEVREVIVTDSAQPPAFVIPIEMPKEEGTCVLDVRASWEPVAGHESGTRCWAGSSARGVAWYGPAGQPSARARRSGE
ncbi:MAG: hypothetical protein U0835_03600 [Isosphaeraceae bacterium]